MMMFLIILSKVQLLSVKVEGCQEVVVITYSELVGGNNTLLENWVASKDYPVQWASLLSMCRTFRHAGPSPSIYATSFEKVMRACCLFIYTARNKSIQEQTLPAVLTHSG